MLTLFPKYRMIAGVGIVFSAVLAGIMIHSGAAMQWPVLMVVVCWFISIAAAELAAASYNRRLLLILYLKNDPKEFIRQYEPLLNQKHLPPVQELNVRAYLGNAHLALGESEQALSLLNGAPKIEGKEAFNAEALLAGNRCSIYLQMEDADRAIAELDRLVRLEKSAVTGKKAENYESLFGALPVLRARCALLQNRVVNEDALRKAADKSVAHIVKFPLQLDTARMDLLLGNKNQCRDMLSRLAKEDHSFYAVRKAEQLLKKFP